MGDTIALREDFAGPDLRRLAKATKDAAQSRRLLALVEICDCGARSDAARIGGVGLQVMRDWVRHINADRPNGLIDRKAPGPAPKPNTRQHLLFCPLSAYLLITPHLDRVREELFNRDRTHRSLLRTLDFTGY